MAYLTYGSVCNILNFGKESDAGLTNRFSFFNSYFLAGSLDNIARINYLIFYNILNIFQTTFD